MLIYTYHTLYNGIGSQTRIALGWSLLSRFRIWEQEIFSFNLRSQSFLFLICPTYLEEFIVCLFYISPDTNNNLPNV